MKKTGKFLAVAAAAMILAGCQCPFSSRPALPPATECPLVLDLDQIKATVVAVRFTREVAGSKGDRRRIADKELAQQRLAVVTLRVTKPTKTQLILAAADLSLHYSTGGMADVAPCEGLSTFSVTQSAPRPIELGREGGPGSVKQTTDATTNEPGTVYIDAVFRMTPQKSGNLWVCVAQPGTPKRYTGNE